jgi:methylenetetrahydrofolate--tRNA-(uracil-5-)-methyltransferase
MDRVIVIGGGLAGCEAAFQLARRGIYVDLYEMKPRKKSAAHHLDALGELVCSNSLGSDLPDSAGGLLKAELRLLGSVVLEAADETRVPAGGALAVDRVGFSAALDSKIRNNPYINVIEEEMEKLPDAPCVICATGPLTSEALSGDIQAFAGGEALYFYDAAAPIVTRESVDFSKVYEKARYDKGTPDYLNCPMTREEYEAFYQALAAAETAPLKSFEHVKVFEGCMPVEVMAKRGPQTLLFGPLRPVGLADPRSGKEPYAVVQLRRDDAAGALYNLVGFQTNLKFGAQKRVFSMIPGLENADFARYGVMHRNSYLNAPKLLNADYGAKTKKGLYFAGQLSGVEGYAESVSSGLAAGINAFRYVTGKPPLIFPTCTAIGALAGYIANASPDNFQPMNSNFGIIDGLTERVRAKKERYGRVAQRAIETMRGIVENELGVFK